jgi:ATPase subunit of ABC transporter with duplicated ATPase domains
MPSIALRAVSCHATHPLFQNLTLTIGEDDRLGIVAGNGAGKTTLLRCLAGEAEPSDGSITRSRGLRLGLVPQDIPTTLLELPLDEAIRRAIPPAERDSQAWRVDLVLDEFAAPAELRRRPVRSLSGGWQRLALIARAWVQEPDALLLDEPTNHLDLETIRRLEGWLNDPTRRIALVIASHDRRFLDACTRRTLFLRPDRSHLYAHPYSAARSLLEADDSADDVRLARDAKEADRLRRSASALRNIGINSRSDKAQVKSAQMTRRAEQLEQTLHGRVTERSGDIRLRHRSTHAPVLLALDDVPVPAPDGRQLFRSGRLMVHRGDRIALLGRNGVGKSVLIRLLHQAVTVAESIAGIRVNPSVVVGYVDQQMAHLPDDATPFGFVTSAFRLGDQRSRSLLAGAGFAVDRQQQRIAGFSLGQRARLGLLALRLTEPNLYLLDEPTNHVDIAGQEALEAEILAQTATCVLVSHDRHFVAAVATRFLLIENGRLREVDSHTG